MAVPWVQIVQLMPSILEVSRELLKRSRRAVQTPPPVVTDTTTPDAALAARIASLE